MGLQAAGGLYSAIQGTRKGRGTHLLNQELHRRMAGQGSSGANAYFGHAAPAIAAQIRAVPSRSPGLTQINTGYALNDLAAQQGVAAQQEALAASREMAIANQATQRRHGARAFGIGTVANTLGAQLSTQEAQNQAGPPQPAPEEPTPAAHPDAIISDERRKQNIRDGGAATDQMLDSMSPKQFSMKPGQPGADREHTGIVAQDLEQSPAGRNVVEQRSDGTRVLNRDRAVEAALAANARLNQRLRSLEAQVRRQSHPDVTISTPPGGDEQPALPPPPPTAADRFRQEEQAQLQQAPEELRQRVRHAWATGRQDDYPEIPHAGSLEGVSPEDARQLLYMMDEVDRNQQERATEAGTRPLATSVEGSNQHRRPPHQVHAVLGGLRTVPTGGGAEADVSPTVPPRTQMGHGRRDAVRAILGRRQDQRAAEETPQPETVTPGFLSFDPTARNATHTAAPGPGRTLELLRRQREARDLILRRRLIRDIQARRGARSPRTTNGVMSDTALDAR